MSKRVSPLFISTIVALSLTVAACSSKTKSSSSQAPTFGYYTSYLKDKLYTLSKIKEQNHIDYSFAFVTDLHWDYNTKRTPFLLKTIQEQYPLDKIVLGGDYISKDYDDIDEAKAMIEECIEPFSSFNYMAIIGNHDSNNNDSEHQTPQIPDVKIYNIINNSNNEYPYSLEKDEQNKICSFYLDSGTGMGTFSDFNQKQFLYDNLMSLDASWNVLIFIHIIFDGSYENNNLSVIQKAGIDFTSYLDSFSNQLECQIIGVFSGHSHLDHLDTTSYSCPFITTTCDSLGVYNPYYNIYPRKKDSVSEQAFDIVQVDTHSHRVYLTRIGGGSDRYYSY